MRDIPGSYDARRVSPWDGCAGASLPVKEHQMHRSTENHRQPALGVRIWTWLLAALHESRRQEAARVIRRHRDLIQNFQVIELAGRRVGPGTDA